MCVCVCARAVPSRRCVRVRAPQIISDLVRFVTWIATPPLLFVIYVIIEASPELIATLIN